MKPTLWTSWSELQKHIPDNRNLPQDFLFDLNKSECVRHAAGINLDFSKQRINKKILQLLIQLAHESQLKEKIHNMMKGDIVNVSENKAALHTSLRSVKKEPLFLEGCNIVEEIFNSREQIKKISELVRSQKWLGYTGLAIRDVVNIGIGGSDLGPRLSINALSNYCSKDVKFHFISDADPESFNQVLAQILPETTLFIISSKSFTTKETILNAGKALSLYAENSHLENHFIAVTAYPERALEFNIKTILPIWDWVGGRYSLCSSINLITAIAVGYEHFSLLLEGANSMDEHTLNAPFEENLPVLMALLGIWNNNFLNIHNLLILAYSKHFEYLVPYVQQLDMESNGKSFDLKGSVVPYATGPIVWGGLGNQAQHSYFQLLCQGTHHCAVDFLILKTNEGQMINAMCDYKIKVLSEGLGSQEQKNSYIPAKTPMNKITLENCSPFTLGALIALYEHKIYAQSVIWNINPFDQPGVESAKLSLSL